MSNIIVLGAGMVGSAMALDLAKKHKVTVTDINTNVLNKLKAKNNNITTFEMDASDKELLTNTITPFDLVICAVPGFMGYKTLENIIRAKKNVVDISFFPENSLDLSDLAKEMGVTAIVDCGVAPGMDNVILGYWNEKLNLTDFECLVGGLPKVKKFPFEYKAPFSPCDVIEEYTRPARYVENGHIVTKPAMSDIEYVEIPKVGTLQSFNSDGLRSIMFTMPHIINMKEKTLRYVGHIEKMQVLEAAGFFKTEKINVNGTEMSPLDFTSKVLFDEWKLGEEEEEMTVMRVIVQGTDSNGTVKKITYTLHDEYCNETKTSSMARTTGYTATAAAEMFLNGMFTDKGVFPPELFGKHEEIYNHFMSYLKSRNIHYMRTEETVTTKELV